MVVGRSYGTQKVWHSTTIHASARGLRIGSKLHKYGDPMCPISVFLRLQEQPVKSPEVLYRQIISYHPINYSGFIFLFFGAPSADVNT
jgi:hypothetical protein